MKLQIVEELFEPLLISSGSVLNIMIACEENTESRTVITTERTVLISKDTFR